MLKPLAMSESDITNYRHTTFEHIFAQLQVKLVTLALDKLSYNFTI